jgi:parallel beta-helix repeat protein
MKPRQSRTRGTRLTPWFVAITLSITAAGRADPIQLYVSTSGNDAWSGRLVAPNASRTDGPLATLAQARETVRRLRKEARAADSVTVMVRGGAYGQSETLRFLPEDGGTAASPVVYRAYPGERPILRGGRNVTGFTPHSGRVLKADLSSQELKGGRFKELYFAGRRLPLARYPNQDPGNPYGGGWAFADGQPVPMYQDVPGEDRHTLHYRSVDQRIWSKPNEVEVFVFPRYNWWNNIVAVHDADRSRRTITLAGEASYPIRPGDRYYFRNGLEELDAPGEWYLDGAASVLYVWPPEPIDEEHAIVAPVVSTLVEIEPGTSYLMLRGFTLESCTGEAVDLERTNYCTIAGCTIRGVGDYDHGAIRVAEGTRNAIVGNDISDVGSHGVAVSGGDRVTLTPAENAVANNYIHHVGVLYKQGVGILLEGVGNRASHNLIHDGPRMGIMFSGNNLLIEYNHVRHMNLETEDTGAVYTGGRDWISSRGTVIRFNRFHDMLGFGKDERGRKVSPHFAWGVYLDDNTGGVDVTGNIVYRCSRAGLHVHNGRDNHIFNNIFVDNGPQQYEYSGWTRDHGYWKDHLPTMITGYERVASSPAWKKMRNMNIHPRDAVLPDGLIMTGNEFTRNIIAYRDPDASMVRTSNVPFAHNLADFNLIWHQGMPIGTGQHVPANDSSMELVPNADFSRGRLAELPADWQWQIKPPRAAAAMIEENGRRALRIEAVFDAAKPHNNYPIIVSREFPASPGHWYRIKARMRATHAGARAGLMLQGYEANAYFWTNWPSELKVGTDWNESEFVFRIPGPGEHGYHYRMKQFRARVDFIDPWGSLLVSGVSLRELEMLDEWASWQALGMDRHARVADPRFVDPDHDDFRLRPDSPAFALGFEPIPVEKIGPYQDKARATWPIVEAPGAREFPVRPPR